MKLETLILQAVFSACLLLCVLVIGAMLTAHVSVPHVAANHAPMAMATVRAV
jgi:hypothetical protein